jgi:predicted transglutaminase-like cysteine proteinase
MSSITKITVGGALVALISFGSPAQGAAGGVQQVDFSNPAFAPVTGPTSIPVGAAEFCKANRNDCAPDAHVVPIEALTNKSWQQLTAVNDSVNRNIIPETDEQLYHVAEYWTYPTKGAGDCEDIALQKRKELIAAGWDQSTLLMTVVREHNGDGHAVLMVRTDRGDLILDNQAAQVLVWNQTPYEYIKRQSQTDAGKWVGLNDDRPVITAAAN